MKHKADCEAAVLSVDGGMSLIASYIKVETKHFPNFFFTTSFSSSQAGADVNGYHVVLSAICYSARRF